MADLLKFDDRKAPAGHYWEQQAFRWQWRYTRLERRYNWFRLFSVVETAALVIVFVVWLVTQ